MTADNPFRRFWNAGYRRLLPIVPPGSPISEKSTLAKRPKAVGKAPGIKGDDGLWRSFNWNQHETTEADLDLWHGMGAGVGIRTGQGLVGVDIDTLDDALAEECHALADVNLGETFQRIGRAPKRLLVYRVTDDIAYRRVKFAGGLVELLSDDRQFVAHGTHPDTLQPYAWPDGIGSYDAAPLVTPEQLAEFFDLLAAKMPAAEQTVSVLATGSAATDQRQLLGEPDAIAAAVEALPNTTELFPTYDDYVRVGYAIKGATQDDALGLELFQAWAAKWPEGNDPDQVAADWYRCKPPYRVGAQYLYSLAERHGAGFRAAETWFSDQPSQSTNPFDAAPQEPPQALEPLRWIDPAAWEGVEPPPREWEVDGWIPRKQVTLLYGEGGIGKTLLIHQYGICAAAGISWLGQKTRQARVCALFCEDDEEELQRRHHDLMRQLGVSHADLGGRFRFVSRVGEDNLLAVVNRATGALAPTPFYRQVLDDALAWRADVTITDTIADTFGGSEIDRGHVNSFVKTILGGIVRATRGSVVALGHPSVAGRTEGRSGSTAWSNASRSRIYLQYPKGSETGDARELIGKKLNYGPVGNKLKLQWRRGAFDVLSASTKIDLNAFKDSDGVPDLEATVEAMVLAAWSAAGDVGLSLQTRARAFAGRVLRDTGHAGLRAYSDDEIVAALRRLVQAGAVETDGRGVMMRAAANVFN